MSDFVRACSLDEVPELGAHRVKFDDLPVAIVRSEGEVYAIHDVCSHEEVALSEGDVEDTTIECWLHGSCFDLRTGRPTSLPATKPVIVYPVKIEGADVYVRLTEES
jgi:3-phenylpropionate/trans-cinnamate dioxygenase ferredoxin component